MALSDDLKPSHHVQQCVCLYGPAGRIVIFYLYAVIECSRATTIAGTFLTYYYTFKNDQLK